jgi:hypothetical protein
VYSVRGQRVCDWDMSTTACVYSLFARSASWPAMCVAVAAGARVPASSVTKNSNQACYEPPAAHLCTRPDCVPVYTTWCSSSYVSALSSEGGGGGRAGRQGGARRARHGAGVTAAAAAAAAVSRRHRAACT